MRDPRHVERPVHDVEVRHRPEPAASAPCVHQDEDARVPIAGRFNFGQKQFFWLTLWATVALLVSGLVLWVPQWIPAQFASVLLVAVFVHAVASLVTIAGIIVHICMGVAIVPGGLRTIVSDDVTEAWARRHHSLWAAEVARPDAAGRSPSASSSPVTSDAGSGR